MAHRSFARFIAAATMLGALGALPACGAEQDDRPAELDYIVQTILAPACGTPACHSSSIQTAGFALDTIDATRQAIADKGLVIAGEPESSSLLYVMTGDTEERMPPDGPLPDADIEFIRAWIAAGAEGVSP